MSTPSALTPVTLLTGFLGSGKTTALNHLLAQPELSDTLVIINEFGEMALDHLLVAHSTENLVMEMSSGCLCCTIRGDLVTTLRDISWRFSRNGQRQFKRVLIETTGLADPAPIIHTLMTHPQIASLYRLDGIVATVDMVTGMQTLDQYHEAVKQAAVADALLLTKIDLVSPEQRDALLQRLSVINPAAPRWDVLNGVIEPNKVLGLGLFSADDKAPDVENWLRAEAYELPTHDHTHQHDHAHHDHGHNHHHDINRHDDYIRAFCFSVAEPISEEMLMAWLDLLMGFVGVNILRVKAILNVEGHEHPIAVHGVQHIFHPPVTLPAWPNDDRRSRLVFITKDVGQDVIEQTFTALKHALTSNEEAQR